MRWVMVDDTDPGVKYTGDWFADTGSLDSSGNWGPPYLSTLHGTKTQGSLSYNFSALQLGSGGPTFTLTGAIQVTRTSTSTNTTWECLVDGASIAVDNPAAVENRIEFCAGSGLTDGPHTLQVNAKGSSSQTFWFDHLQYQPSASVSLANAAIYVDTTDPMWGFGTSWNPVFPGYMTNQTGAKVDFEFNGVSFKWYGFYDARFPFAISTGSYSIDGAAPVNFSLNGVAAQHTSVQYSQVFFTTNTVSPGNHKVEVTYNGDTSTTPLSVQVVIIQNGTSTSGGGTTSSGGTLPTGSSTSGGGTTGSSSGGSTTPTGSISGGSTASGSTSNGQTSDAAKSNTGAIVGGVVGGVAILLLAALLFFWMSKRRKYRTMTEAPELMIEPEPYFDHPTQRSVYSPVSGTSRGRTHGSAPYDSQSYPEASSYPPTTPTPFQSPPSSTQAPRAIGKANELQQPPSRLEASRVVQDVDSGIRLMAVDGDNPELVQVLPPVYSQL